MLTVKNNLVHLLLFFPLCLVHSRVCKCRATAGKYFIIMIFEGFAGLHGRSVVFLHPGSMRKVSLGRPSRSIYVSLACLTLALHLLLAFFCLSVLHTSCIPPSTTTTSSSSAAAAAVVRKPAGQRREFVLAPSVRTPSPPKLLWDENPLNQTIAIEARNAKATFGNAAGKERKLTAARKLIEKVKRRDKLEALFRHRLYNLPLPELRDEDRLLLVMSQPVEKDSSSSYDSSDTSG